MEFIAIDSIFPNWNVFEFFMHRFMTHVLPIDSLRIVQQKNKWTLTLAIGICEDHKRKIDFVGNGIAPTAYFFVIFLRLILNFHSLRS